MSRLLVVALLACTAPVARAPAPLRPVPLATPRCLADTEPAAQATLAMLLRPVRAMVPEAAWEQPVLVTASCTERRYTFADQPLRVYRSADGSVGGTVGTVDATSLACLDDTARAARASLPYAGDLVARARAKLGETAWRDPRGPMRWVSCASAEGSVGLLLHELHHALRDGSCLHVPGGAPLCFGTLDRLPTRALATIDAWPGAVTPALLPYYRANQELYLRIEEHGPVGLVDELLGYAISTDVVARLAEPSRREPVFLPLLAAQCARYLVELRRTDPARFTRNFAPGSGNRVAIERAFAIAERSYEAWRVRRQHVWPVATDVDHAEDALWELYREARRTIDRG